MNKEHNLQTFIANNIETNMEISDFEIFELEKHDTKDINAQNINGYLTVVWRDWDKIIQNIPKMVYVTSVFKNEVKGPHLHKKRSSYFTCIHGKVEFVIRDKHGKYHEIEMDAEKPKLVHVPKNIASAHVNLSHSTSIILTLADIAWKPNDNEMENVAFDDYDWEQWNNNI